VTVSWPRDKLPPSIAADEKWIDARITPGTLTVYVGLEPVYATLFSPGKGGHPVPGLDHTKYATTQTGIFRYEWKERVATMSNEKGDPKVLWFRTSSTSGRRSPCTSPTGTRTSAFPRAPSA
jgi:hypothetical protein